MSFLNDLINTLSGQHQQAQPQQKGGGFNLTTAMHDIPLVSDAIQSAMRGRVTNGPDLIHGEQAQHSPVYLQPHVPTQFAHPSGGGYGSLPPQQMPNLPNGIQGGQVNPGFIPLQGSRGAGTGAFGLQGGNEQQPQNTRNPQNVVPWQ